MPNVVSRISLKPTQHPHRRPPCRSAIINLATVRVWQAKKLEETGITPTVQDLLDELTLVVEQYNRSTVARAFV